MAIVPSGFVHQQQIADSVRRAEERLAPDVIRIRYTLGADWSGAESIFFRVVLSDRVTSAPKLAETTQRVSTVIDDAVKPAELGLEAYFNFRSESEQAALQDAGWA